jgi:hypothetical protein
VEVPENVDSGETDGPAVMQHLHGWVRKMRISGHACLPSLSSRYGKMPVRMLTPTMAQSYGALAKM